MTNFVGYTENFQTYRLFDPDKKMIITSCDVVFTSNVGPIHNHLEMIQPSNSEHSQNIHIDIIDPITDETSHTAPADNTFNDIQWRRRNHSFRKTAFITLRST